MKDSCTYKHIIHIFILRWRRLCVIGIQSNLIFSLSSPRRKHEHPLCFTYFLFMAGYRDLHTSGGRGSGNLLILSASGNICHSILRQWIIFFAILLYLLFPVNLLCWCYIATALNLLSSSTVSNSTLATLYWFFTVIYFYFYSSF